MLKEDKPVAHGHQFILVDNTPVTWYTSGTVQVQGRVSDIQKEVKEIFSRTAPHHPVGPRSVQGSSESTSPNQAAPKRVFIVHGHDTEARDRLELMLRRFNLDPIVLQNIPGSGDTLIEKLETFADADFACVLLTPDDKGHPAQHPNLSKYRARQNVVLELGMVLAKLGRERVAILMKGGDMEKPSDIEGLIYIEFNDRVDEAKNHLAANLHKAGFEISPENMV